MSVLWFAVFSFITLIAGGYIASDLGMSNPMFSLDQNQVLYLFSTSAQVLAGVYGLTLVGFIFYMEHLSKEIDRDDSREYAIKYVQEEFRKLFIFLTVLVVLVLIFSNIVVMYATDKEFKYVWLLNFSQLAYFVALILIAWFIYLVTDVKSIKKFSKSQLDRIQKGLEGNISVENVELFKDKVQKIISEIETHMHKNYMSYMLYHSGYRVPPINYSIKVLASKKVISRSQKTGLVKILKAYSALNEMDSPMISEALVQDAKNALNELNSSLR